ncbi:MAG TPA: ABC transporter ATP-binding protein [Virgibacillus sp.]|nr:ABC transporter ATP-binding protein [Virgibacillus sp.]
MDKNKHVLEVKNLKTHFFTERGVIPAVDGVSFHLNEGELVGIVGESGSGKSVTSLSIMDLIEEPGRIVDGEVLYNGKDLVPMSESEMRRIRGNDIAMIFQEPLTSLNPVLTIGKQITEAILMHQDVSKQEAKKQAIELLNKVRIPRAEQVYGSYPHLLSGGMRQRVMIAMALSCNPKILIADEPTTALDVTIQAQIIKLLKELSKDFGAAIMLITHDLGVIAEMVDRVVVMYGGKVVEQTDVHTLFKSPQHPYTQGLINSTPRIHELKDELQSIKGNVPSPDMLPTGCKFHPRCEFAMDICREKDPALETIADGHEVRCWLHEDKFQKGGVTNEHIEK